MTGKYELNIDRSGKWRLWLKAANDQGVASSGTYGSETPAQHRIASLNANADAATVDLT